MLSRYDLMVIGIVLVICITMVLIVYALKNQQTGSEYFGVVCSGPTPLIDGSQSIAICTPTPFVR